MGRLSYVNETESEAEEYVRVGSSRKKKFSIFKNRFGNRRKKKCMIESKSKSDIDSDSTYQSSRGRSVCKSISGSVSRSRSISRTVRSTSESSQQLKNKLHGILKRSVHDRDYDTDKECRSRESITRNLTNLANIIQAAATSDEDAETPSYNMFQRPLSRCLVGQVPCVGGRRGSAGGLSILIRKEIKRPPAATTSNNVERKRSVLKRFYSKQSY